jgi:hypothetical protein
MTDVTKAKGVGSKTESVVQDQGRKFWVKPLIESLSLKNALAAVNGGTGDTTFPGS